MAAASKSLQRWTVASPKAARSSSASIVHGQLVSTHRRPWTGPAIASTACRTDVDRPLASRNASTASAKLGKSATENRRTGPTTPFDSSANRALVAPISPNNAWSRERPTDDGCGSPARPEPVAAIDDIRVIHAMALFLLQL